MRELEGLSPDVAARLTKARERVIDSIGKNMDLYGITQSVGRMYGYMYFHNGPVTLDSLSASMGMSKTTMSNGVRTLLDLKMIDKVWSKGSRKDRYEVVPDWYANFSDFFSIRWRKAVEANMSAMTRSLKEIRELMAEAGAEDERLQSLLKSDEAKINEALKYYRWLLRLIEALETGKIFELVPREEE
jgi:DNA-binding transcriptional regulator GbsR (MarR family)